MTTTFIGFPPPFLPSAAILTSPNTTSVFTLLSCTSSTTTAAYLPIPGSTA
eukprot:CAMPEP_0174910960 /NCGR_PEP_ID=MMETSP0167-20121228/74746_1 /TAXON_ID=38298 /ORGANISM="Rhodella maculata, Strain CCMP736" /LENGTH=50 /DNA_ID=CAMNT_0016155361 /DNA_START=35 /DNA_END=184 /DNA_ORIENTATION=-